jgi:methionyl-tRNA formyltransferase
MIYKVIAILTDDSVDSWIYPYLIELKSKLKQLYKGIQVDILFNHDELKNYDLVFVLSYSKIIPDKIIESSSEFLVVHESDLPVGKGFAPITYDVLDGKSEIYFCLLKILPNQSADSGILLLKEKINLNGFELCADLRKIQGTKTIELCLKYFNIDPTMGSKIIGNGTFNKRRYPKDSEIEITKSILDQFNILRVVDNERYPAFFMHLGKKFIIKIYRDDHNDT